MLVITVDNCVYAANVLQFSVNPIFQTALTMLLVVLHHFEPDTHSERQVYVAYYGLNDFADPLHA